MKPSKRLAGVVALATVAAGVSVVVGTSAANAAGPPSSMTCNTGGNGGAYASTWNDTSTFTMTPASVAQGGTVTATWTSAVGLGDSGPATITAGSTQFQALVKLSGAMTGSVVVATTPGAYPINDTPGNPAFPGGTTYYLGPIGSGAGAIPATTTFTASGAGTLTGTVQEIDWNSNSVDTYCSPSAAGNFPATSDPFPTYLTGYTPNWQTPAPATGIGTAGSFVTSNLNYNDLQLAAGDTTVATASNTVVAPSLVNGQVTGQITGVTAYAAKTNVLNLTGANWPTGVAVGGFTAALCNTTLTTCDANAVNALTSDGSGNLTGTVTVPSSPTVGARTLKVTATVAGSVGTANYTILTTPTFTISPVAGPVGSVTAGTAAGFAPSDAAVAFAAIGNTGFYGLPNGTNGGCTGVNTPTVGCIAVGPFIPGPTNAISAVTTNASGGWTGNITVADSATTEVEFATKTVCSAVGVPAGGCTGGAGTPFNTTATIDGLATGAAIAATWSFDVATCSTTEITGTSTCNTNQHVYASILAGSLTQTVSSTGTFNPSSGTTFNIQLCDPAPTAAITLAQGKVAPCAVSVPTTNQTYAGQLNPITVTDTRGATVGWNLTATAANLSDGTHTIAHSALTITPACVVDAAAPNSATGVTAGTAGQNFGGTVTLCSKDTTLNAGGTTGGVYDVSTSATGVSLAVPAFQAAGNYTTNMVINLA